MRRFERARKPEEKEVRIRAILAAARALGREEGLGALSLSAIARRAGLSKANLYRYFESREEILLRLLAEECFAWAGEVEAALPQAGGSMPVMADIVTSAFLSRPLLCELLGMVAPILEHNLTAGPIAAAKRDLLGASARAVAALVQQLPFLAPEAAAWAVNTVSLYVAGMWPAAQPSKAAAQVLRRPEFALLRIDGARDLKRFVVVLLSGLFFSESSMELFAEPLRAAAAEIARAKKSKPRRLDK